VLEVWTMKEERSEILACALATGAGSDKANREMGLSSPVLSDQQFAVGRALVASVIRQEGMHRRMKEQTCSKRRPHDATSEGY
jgi:hypothetical protein